MSAILMLGKACAEEVYRELREGPMVALRKRGITPTLLILRHESNAAGEIYARQKKRAIEAVGGACIERVFSGSRINDVVSVLVQAEEDPNIHGIIVQLPFFGSEYDKFLVKYIPAEKDVDRLSIECVGNFYDNQPFSCAPCTPMGVIELLNFYHVSFAWKRAVVIGRSALVGKPLAHMLTELDATVTVCHSTTAGLADIVRQADIVVSATGVPHMVKKDWVKPGAVVVDVGITKVDGKICGDVDPEVAKVASLMTPVPGGVGPMTVAMLVRNTVMAAAT